MRGATGPTGRWVDGANDFNPHSPCGERHAVTVFVCRSSIFQSTLPMRGATFSNHNQYLQMDYFNPHSPCGERQLYCQFQTFRRTDFNPHSPCGERLRAGILFRETSLISIHTPHAGSDKYLLNFENPGYISIHTPHAGSDRTISMLYTTSFHFNPHSPCGERQYPRPEMAGHLGFQSTLPMRGATHYFKLYFDRLVISIHTPHAGSDNPMHSPTTTVVRFQSTLPMRGATHTPSSSLLFGSIFQSTLPMRGAT